MSKLLSEINLAKSFVMKMVRTTMKIFSEIQLLLLLSLCIYIGGFLISTEIANLQIDIFYSADSVFRFQIPLAKVILSLCLRLYNSIFIGGFLISNFTNLTIIHLLNIHIICQKQNEFIDDQFARLNNRRRMKFSALRFDKSFVSQN